MKATPASIHIAKSHNADPQAKTWQRVWLPLRTTKDNDNLNNIKQTKHARQGSTGGNRRLAQWRVTWLIEHTTSLYRPEFSLHLLKTKSVNKNEEKDHKK